MTRGEFPIPRLVAEVLEVNQANGWFEENRSWPMTKALLHSEVSEMLEAYRDHEFRVPYTVHETHLLNMRLMEKGNEEALMALQGFKMFQRQSFEDPTVKLKFSFSDGQRMALARVGVLKPEGFGSELADVLIRWLDTVHRLEMNAAWFEKLHFTRDDEYRGDVGAAIDHLHDNISMITQASQVKMGGLLITIYNVAEEFGVKLEDEYKFKLAYNRTRGHKHGGKLA